jgi:hypothetical protein
LRERRRSGRPIEDKAEIYAHERNGFLTVCGASAK